MNWDALRKRIKGTVINKSEPAFASIRAAMVWNEIKPDRSPEVIITVQDDDDVVEAVNFARENGLKIAVHGGGHTWCGLAVRNGGMSWNMSEWGPACFSIHAIEFVTADGKKIKASTTEHTDLFWAARGCGPGMFAVATRFHLKCYPLPKSIMTSSYFYSLAHLPAVVEEVTELGWKMPSIVELSIFLIKAPPELADQCKNTNGKLCMVTAVAFAHTKAEGTAALAILERGAMVPKCLAKQLNEPSNFEQLSDVSGISWPEHHRNLCENQCSKAKPSDILMALRDKIIDAPSPKSIIVFCQSTGQHNLLEPHADVALSMDAQSYGGSWAIWEKPEDDAANMKWQDETIAIIKTFTSTHYIGETDIVQDNARVQESYTPEKWKKLEKIRAKYDPEDLFFGYLGGTTPS